MKKTKRLLAFIAIIFLIGMGFWIVYAVENIETKNMDEAARKNVAGKYAVLSAGITHYDEAGADTANTVILVHGFSVPYYIWDNVFDSLVQQGFHVVRYDEYGRGFSDRPTVKYKPEIYRQQLFDLISSLKIKTPVALAGVSFGGAVVADFAAHHPEMVNKVILVDPVFEFNRAGSSELLANYVMAYDHEKRAKGQMDDFKYPQRFPGWVEKYKVQMEYKGFRHALISTNFNYSGDAIRDNYKSLDALHKNVLLIWGKEDNTVPFRFSDSLRNILHVDFFPVNDAAHLPYLEQPAVVIPKMISFLKE